MRDPSGNVKCECALAVPFEGHKKAAELPVTPGQIEVVSAHDEDVVLEGFQNLVAGGSVAPRTKLYLRLVWHPVEPDAWCKSFRQGLRPNVTTNESQTKV